MKKLIVIFILLVLIIGCQATTFQDDPINAPTLQAQQEETMEMKEVSMIIENQELEIKLYSNEAVNQFITQLPLTIQMNELHGNEKYNYLDFSLPSQSESIRNIKSGDIMLFGNNCLVLFYEDLTTSYQYTKIGYVANSENLKNLVGDQSITITFQIME